MRSHKRWFIVGSATLALGVVFFAKVSSAADEKEKELKDSIIKLSGMIGKNDGGAKKQAEKDPAKWKEWSKEMEDAAKDLAKAAKAKDGKKIKDAANKVNASCNKCHGVFRD